MRYSILFLFGLFLLPLVSNTAEGCSCSHVEDIQTLEAQAPEAVEIP